MNLPKLDGIWTITVFVAVAGISAITAVFPSIIGNLGNIAAVIVILVYVALLLAQRFRDESEAKEIKVSVKETQENTQQIRETVRIIEVDMQKEREERDTTQEDMDTFVANLVNENLISITKVEDLIPDKSFITVFCYQIGFNENIPSGMKFLRLYPKIFKELNFIKPATFKSSQYYIIATDNLFPTKLRSLDNLSDYLLKKAKLALIDEWDTILETAKQKYPKFYNQRKNSENPLNFNMLIIKTNSRNMRHGFLKSNDFNPEFTSELASITELNKLRLNEDEKVGIRRFVLESSLNILVLGLPQREKESLLTLESIFKESPENGGLGIQKFYDYHTKNEQDIYKIFVTKFTSDKATEYAKLVMENSRKYQDYLSRIGVRI